MDGPSDSLETSVSNAWNLHQSETSPDAIGRGHRGDEAPGKAPHHLFSLRTAVDIIKRLNVVH